MNGLDCTQAFNSTDLLWEQISNKDSSVIDSWTVHQAKHGPFPIPAPPPPPPPPPPPSPPMPTPGFLPQRGEFLGYGSHLRCDQGQVL